MGKMVVGALILALVFGGGWFAGAAGLFADAREAVSKAWSERVASRESEPTILSRGVEPVRDVERVAPAAPSNPAPEPATAPTLSPMPTVAPTPTVALTPTPLPSATEPAPALSPSAPPSLCETNECAELLIELARNLREVCAWITHGDIRRGYYLDSAGSNAYHAWWESDKTMSESVFVNAVMEEHANRCLDKRNGNQAWLATATAEARERERIEAAAVGWVGAQR